MFEIIKRLFLKWKYLCSLWGTKWNFYMWCRTIFLFKCHVTDQAVGCRTAPSISYFPCQYHFVIASYCCIWILHLTGQAGRGQLKCDVTRAETGFRLSAKRASQFKSAGVSVQSTIGNRGVRISDSNAEYTMFRSSVKSTGYPLHSPVSPSLSLLCVTVCHHISTGV